MADEYINVQESPQFAMLSPEDRERILRDSVKSGIGSPMMKFAPSAFNQLKEPVNTSIFASDRTPEPARGALSVAAPVAQAPAPVDLSYDSGPAPVGKGALSALPQQRQPFNLQAMIDQFAPKDDSASKYFAIAAALGKPTGFGTMGEKFANVAQALNDQKANQEKLRSQYVPIIMQQVAAQQARDEQAAYKAEAAMQAQQAAAQMQKERLASAQQAQQDRLAQAAALAEQSRAALAERAASDRASREQISADRLEVAGRQNKLDSKAPAGYSWGPVGSDGNPTLVRIKGGPADLKATASEELKAAGATDVESAVTTLRDAYDRLEAGGGITSTKGGTLGNLGASASSSALGQGVGKMLGTQNQSARNDIAMTRPALLAALMKATGMSSKQMDSNAELKLWLATATDPTLDVESNRRALSAIERKYLGGATAPVTGATGSWGDPTPLDALVNKYKSK